MFQLHRFLAALGFAAAFALMLPTSALAYGPHDGLSCEGCHAPHAAKGDFIFAVGPNTKDVNARTGQPEAGTTALCLGCHQDSANGGLGVKPIASHVSHPYGLNVVNSHVANVPSGLLENGNFGCMACHDPHPSNPNYKYLRVDTSGGKDMARFCTSCHEMKAAADESQGTKFFTSMDESKPRDALLSVPAIRPEGSAAPQESAPAAQPAKPAKRTR
ncbi:MAG: cytochrome C [Alphaproteobacteria bacterium]|nr:cytochrome C [Alphaproteobacteria bacterium]